MKGYNVSLTSMGRGNIGFPLRGGASGCVVRLALRQAGCAACPAVGPATG